MAERPDDALAVFFPLFNELGILAQLSAALFEAKMPDGYLISQFAVLNHLIRVKDGRTPMELARAFQVPKTTMTHTISLLEKRGHIRLEGNPKDGRSKLVWLTDDGRKFRDSAIAAAAPDMVALARAFAPERAAEMLPHLTALREIMDNSRPERSY